MQYVSREKEVLTSIDHPFFVRLYFTFQDADNLCIIDHLNSSLSDPEGCPLLPQPFLGQSYKGNVCVGGGGGGDIAAPITCSVLFFFVVIASLHSSGWDFLTG